MSRELSKPIPERVAELAEVLLAAPKVSSDELIRELLEARKAIVEILSGKRYEEGLNRGLYSQAGCPLEEVEKWLLANPTLLDWAIVSETRGGDPRFVGEEEGRWVLAESSAEVPTDVEVLCWGPVAEEICSDKSGYNALDLAQRRGSDVISRAWHEKLVRAGFIENKGSWNYVADPSSEDATSVPRRLGRAFLAHNGEILESDALTAPVVCGLRCSISREKPSSTTGN